MPSQLLSFATGKLEDSPFWKPFADLPASFSDEKKSDLLKRGKTAVEVTMKAFQYLHDEFVAMVSPV